METPGREVVSGAPTTLTCGSGRGEGEGRSGRVGERRPLVLDVIVSGAKTRSTTMKPTLLADDKSLAIN